jgi:D-threo-aldose 1-dehydrogenase
MASLGRRESLRLLGAAYDRGIRHFDVARSYGYGEAEGVLGLFARSRRSEISITTKLGIVPPPRYLSAAPIKRMARSIIRGIPVLRPVLRRTAGRMTRASCFDVATARQSFETSLRKLGSSYVDVLLLHDCTAEQAAEPALRGFLESCIERGLALRYGIASDRGTVLEVATRDGGAIKVAQFPDNIDPRQSILTALPAGTVPITHSVLSRDLQEISRSLSADESLARTWSQAIGVDVSDREQLAALILSDALRRNPGGCVLYSSRSESRLGATVSAVERGLICDPQCARFASLVDQTKVSAATGALVGAA